MAFRYDYSKTMMMKLFLSRPNRKGGSDIFYTFESALNLIKTVDNLTVGAPKIIYLVGWQYNGHDDKYPAMAEVNTGLKREQDHTALDSLLWLMEEAKKYHTVVSLHINLSDAYENSPLFADYRINHALIRNNYGRIAKIERYNGRPCYKISYKEEWESGLFQRKVNRLLSMIPIESAGTIHVDNFQCYANSSPKTSVFEMQQYRKRMIDWFREKNIDVTSEFTYREGNLTSIQYGKIVRERLKTRYPIDLLDKIPAVWWVDNLSPEEIIKFYPHIYGGGQLKNEKYASALYYNIHGEDCWMNSSDPSKWSGNFMNQFALINVPFFYLNSKIKRNYKDEKAGVTIEYTDGTVSDGKKKEIRIGSKILKTKNSVCLPVFWQENGYIAFYEKGGPVKMFLDGRSASLSEITPSGLKFDRIVNIYNGKIEFIAKENTGYFIRT